MTSEPIKKFTDEELAGLCSGHPSGCKCLMCRAKITIMILRAEVANVKNDMEHWKRDQLKIDQLKTELTNTKSEQDRLRSILLTIQEWDCLNPPQADLCADLPWLRRTVDAGLQPPTKEVLLCPKCSHTLHVMTCMVQINGSWQCMCEFVGAE